jgi:energy-coupling factor transporter transmembrane protein EcfT
MNWLRRIHQEEEEDDYDEYFGGDDENLIMANQFLQQQAFGPRRRHNPDAPPRWPNKRDHAAGDAQIRADYFGPNPVYSPMHFRRRNVSKLHKIDGIAMSQQIMSHFMLAGFVCVLMSLRGLLKLFRMLILTSTSSMMQLVKLVYQLCKTVSPQFTFSHTVSLQTSLTSMFI